MRSRIDVEMFWGFFFFGVIFSDAIQKGCGFVLSCVVSAVTVAGQKAPIVNYTKWLNEKNTEGGLNDSSEEYKKD